MLDKKKYIKNYTLDRLKQELEQSGFEKYRSEQIFNGIYVNRKGSFEEIGNLPKDLVDFLEKNFNIGVFGSYSMRKSADGSIKLLYKLEDGNSIEAVYMPWHDEDNPERVTLCISSMAGCPLECAFCATGTMGLIRNLETAEIVDQILETEKIIGKKINNIVFMGMGEPLMNFRKVEDAIEILTDEKNKLLSRRKITLSTSGIPEKITRLADIKKPVKLAISLHATTNGSREKIMPIAKSHNLQKLLDSVELYYRATKMPITYEYIPFKDYNDSEEDAKRLAKIAKRVPSRVNLIPFNDISFTGAGGISAQLKPLSPEEMQAFGNSIRKHGGIVVIRDTFGKDIEGACGQLALSEGKNND